ncbi:MAG: Bug family tripartite tricarboxylate transporter substrate binding protein [Geminicoccaceae bacterium]
MELVVMAGKGGGADKMARLFAHIVEEEQLSLKPFTPVNMPGESGAEAMSYLQSKTADAHTIMVTLNSFYTTPLRRPDLSLDISTFTPIARMAEDSFVLWVHTDAEIKSLQQFVEAAQSAGSDWTMAGTGSASEDNLLTDFLNTAFDLDMAYLPFKGGGAVAKELAQKRVNSTVNNPAEQENYFLEGTTRPLAAFTEERLDVFPEVPTFREGGEDLVYYMQRSVVGPPDMPQDAIDYYRDIFREVYETKAWQDYMNEKSLRGRFITSDALQQYWLDERDAHQTILRGMGQVN